MSNTSKIAQSGLWLTGSYLLGKVSQLVAQIVLARLLVPEDFGIWAMVLVVTTLTDLFRDRATATVLVQRGLEDKKLVDAVYSLGIDISMAMFVIQSLAALPISWFFQQPILVPMIICVSLKFLINAGTGTRGAILQRQMKFRQLAVCTMTEGFARMGGALLFASFGVGVWAFVAGEIARAIADAVMKRFYCPYSLTYHLVPDREALRKVWSFTGSVIGINLAVYANTTGDDLLIGKLVGAQSLGLYNLAYQLAMLPAFALSQINRINFSVLSQRDREGQKAYLQQMLEYYALLYSPLYSIGFVIAPWIIPRVYGEQWSPVVPLFQIVLIYAYTRGFMSILGTALKALNRPGVNAAINWTLVPISVPAFFIGAWLGGAKGVAIAVAIVMGIGASFWFWTATCRVAGWSLWTLAKPVILPTVTAILTSIIVIVSTDSLSLAMQMFVQPLLVVVIDVLLLTIFSVGQIPKTTITLLQRILKPKMQPGNSKNMSEK